MSNEIISYCPICQPRPDGENVVIEHHSKCLEPLIKIEGKKLEMMNNSAKQQRVLDAIIEINQAIAGNSR